MKSWMLGIVFDEYLSLSAPLKKIVVIRFLESFLKFWQVECHNIFSIVQIRVSNSECKTDSLVRRFIVPINWFVQITFPCLPAATEFRGYSPWAIYQIYILQTYGLWLGITYSLWCCRTNHIFWKPNLALSNHVSD